MRSASAVSSSVDRNASTSWCGRCRTNPTVSVSVNPRPERRLGPAHGRVEGGEQRVLDQDPGPGQRVEQARLARVGVPGDHHRRHVTPSPLAALHLTAGGHARDVLLQPGDAGPQPAPVGLQLGLAGTAGADAAAAGHPAARLPGQRLAPAAQPGQHVLQLGQLDLGLALAAARVLGEDIQDQRGPVDDLDLDHALQPAQLARGQLAVADHGVGADRHHDVRQLAGLARAHVGGRVDPSAPLDEAVEHLGARRFCQPAQLAQRVHRAGQAALGPYPDQHDPLKPQRPVLDLADVLQLGGKPGHPPQRVPVLQVHAPETRVWQVGPLVKDGAHAPPEFVFAVPPMVPRRARHRILITPPPFRMCPPIPVPAVTDSRTGRVSRPGQATAPPPGRATPASSPPQTRARTRGRDTTPRAGWSGGSAQARADRPQAVTGCGQPARGRRPRWSRPRLRTPSLVSQGRIATTAMPHRGAPDHGDVTSVWLPRAPHLVTA